MTGPNFAELFRVASAEATRGRARLPFEMLDQWRGAVDVVRAGYCGPLEEYFNDLAIRWSIGATLDSDLLAERPELGWMRVHVAATDERLRALLQDEPLPRSAGQHWWERFPPRYAGPELAADFRSYYGVHVDVHEEPI